MSRYAVRKTTTVKVFKIKFCSHCVCGGVGGGASYWLTMILWIFDPVLFLPSLSKQGKSNMQPFGSRPVAHTRHCTTVRSS